MKIEELEKLSKIELSTEERTALERELQALLGHMKNLSSLTGEAVQTAAPASVTRADAVEPSLSREALLRNAAKSEDGCICVPASFEREGTL